MPAPIAPSEGSRGQYGPQVQDLGFRIMGKNDNKAIGIRA